MNFYYEIAPDAQSVFGERHPYWCLANCSVASASGYMPYQIHDEFLSNSTRAWLENENEVYQIKPAQLGYRYVDTREFTMVKLRARTVTYERK